ncbi:phage late control D family protein [Utexia brackfieldae]|uniref:phage late control D family protein n=1 Tax=Utexia brackfieldae TaxID=3074108 RepID=UPI00370DDEFB
MKKAIFKILYNDKDITSHFDDRLISLEITDNSGFEADTISLELSDTDGKLALPKRGIELNVSFGWNDNQGLIFKNRFVVDECEHTGPPDRLTIRGKSANFRESLNVKRSQSYHDITIGEIVTQIAKRHNLDYKITDKLTNQKIEHSDQTQESDASFLTRVLSDYDAIATVKNGMLIVFLSGASKTVSGEPLPSVVITRSSGDTHTFSIADREAYTGVKAYWLDYKKASISSSASGSPNSDDKSILVGAEGNVKVLRHTYASKQNAHRAATNQWKKLQRGACQFSMTLSEGRPDLCPEMPVKVQGFKKEIDSSEWIITRCTHSITATGGYITSIELEIKL